MISRKIDDNENLGRKHLIVRCGEMALEEAVDLS